MHLIACVHTSVIHVELFVVFVRAFLMLYMYSLTYRMVITASSVPMWPCPSLKVDRVSLSLLMQYLHTSALEEQLILLYLQKNCRQELNT